MLRGNFTGLRTANRMVRPATAGAHSPTDRGKAAQRDSACQLPRNSCAGCCAGSMLPHGTQSLRRTRHARSAPSNCRASRRPATAWERQILPSRIANYDPKILDQLCLTGAVGWGRLSPHPATLEALERRSARRVVPTSVGSDRVFRARRCRLDDFAASPTRTRASRTG